jgi:hypothetical protein
MVCQKSASIYKIICEGGKNSILCRLDIHKKTCQAIVCTEKGNVAKEERITAEKEKNTGVLRI